jgi:hypothetical protein
MFRLASSVLMFAAALGLALAAGAVPIVGGGLAQSVACPDAASPCAPTSTNVDFALDPPTPVKPATGSITFTPTTATIMLSVPTYTMIGASGSVTSLDFTNVSYAVTVQVTTQTFGSTVLINQNLGFGTGSVSGTYDQIGGPGSGPFSDVTASFSNLSCTLVSGQGQCGFNVGTFFGAGGDFAIDVDGAPHNVVQTFNLVVPEPHSLGLVLLGLVGLKARRHRATLR